MQIAYKHVSIISRLHCAYGMYNNDEIYSWLWCAPKSYIIACHIAYTHTQDDVPKLARATQLVSAKFASGYIGALTKETRSLPRRIPTPAIRSFHAFHAVQF